MVSTRRKRSAGAAELNASAETSLVDGTDARISIEQDDNDDSLASRVKKRTVRTSSSSFEASKAEFARKETVRKAPKQEPSPARILLSRPASSHGTVNKNGKRRRSSETISQASEGPAQTSSRATAARTQNTKATRGAPEEVSSTSYTNATNAWNHKTHNATAGVTAIIDRKEQMENGTPCAEPSVEAKQQVLRILESLAVQIVHHLTSLSYEETQSIVLSQESESGAFLRSLSQRFEESKNHFKPHSGFLRAQDEGMTDPEAVSAFRNGNLATFLSAVWNLHPIALYYLNEHFLETFVIDGHRLLAAHAQLFLELKTIMFARSTVFQPCDREEILRELFPTDLEKILLARRPGIKNLAESEVTFIKECNDRHESLLNASANPALMQALKEKYEWQGFVGKIMSYVQKHFVDLVGKEAAEKVRNGTKLVAPPLPPPKSQTQHMPSHPGFINHPPPRFWPQPPMHQPTPRPMQQPGPPPDMNGTNKAQTSNSVSDLGDQAQRAAATILAGPPTVQGPPPPGAPMHMYPPQGMMLPNGSMPMPSYGGMPPRGPGVPPPSNGPMSQHMAYGYAQPQWPAQPPYTFGPSGEILYKHSNMAHPPGLPPPPPGQMYADANGTPLQGQSTYTAYRNARANATGNGKAIPNKTRGGTASQRRAWSDEEEKALLDGMDAVGGAHWAQILALHGENGTKDQLLANRTQVQLKDKARNIKLCILKSNHELPHHFNNVTGELKSRSSTHPTKTKDEARGGAEAGEGSGVNEEGIVPPIEAVGPGITPGAMHGASVTPLPAAAAETRVSVVNEQDQVAIDAAAQASRDIAVLLAAMKQSGAPTGL